MLEKFCKQFLPDYIRRCILKLFYQKACLTLHETLEIQDGPKPTPQTNLEQEFGQVLDLNSASLDHLRVKS